MARSEQDPRDRLAREIAVLEGLTLPRLRADWRDRWGEPPQYRSRDTLLRAAVYRLQAEAFGDLPAPLRRKLADFAQRFNADRKFTPTPGPILKPGSSLIREWGGVRHEVAVTADGFAYQGAAYRSLSQVAEHITGTKWSGPAFFGLKGRAGKAA